MAELLNILVPTSPDLQWTLAIATMTNVACSLVGAYLVLRRMSLLGDALSHAVLPGLVLAFMFSGSLSIGVMFVGAFVVGLLTTFLTQTLHRQAGVSADTSMGIVFTSLFALGVVLLKRFVEGVHLDTDCVWQGSLSTVASNTIPIAGHELPMSFVTILPVLIINLAAIVLLWKEFKIVSFDPELATTLGFRAGVLHYLLMGLVALTTVGSFEAVGSILVVAMLIVPAATAHLLCDRLGWMLVVTAAIAALSAYLGFVGALLVDAEPAGMMSVAAGGLYLLAMLFSPRHGVVAAVVRNMRTTLRIVSEDLLAMLYRLEELTVVRRLGPREAIQAVGGGFLPWLALQTLVRQRFVQSTPELQLSEAGRRRASQLVRSHRLWETYLVKALGLPLDHVHSPAERMEHFIGDRLERDLTADLGEIARDPHGREIPKPE